MAAKAINIFGNPEKVLQTSASVARVVLPGKKHSRNTGIMKEKEELGSFAVQRPRIAAPRSYK